VSGNQPSRRSPKKKGPAKGKGRGGGGQKSGRKRGGKSKDSAIDPTQPLWVNPDGEAEVRRIVGSVRPAHHPTAVVRSLGDPPLGKYGNTAPHYFDAVYRKAQQFAVAIAKANNLHILDETDDEADASDVEGEVSASGSAD
jgi:hypothetical protein